MTIHLNPNAFEESVVHIIGQWGTFGELSKSIKCRVFGHMVRLAAPVVKEYHSDLFWDAQWVESHVNGPLAFDYVVRTSGTHLGRNARGAMGSYAPGGILYGLDLYSVDNRVWNLRVTEVGRSEPYPEDRPTKAGPGMDRFIERVKSNLDTD